MLKVHANIRHYRKMKKMSQDELAHKVGYKNRSAIARIEKGDIDVPQSKIIAIAEALGVDPGQLMGDDGTSKERVTGHFEYYLTGVKDPYHPAEMQETIKAKYIQRLFAYMKLMNAQGIEKLIERADELSALPKYKKDGDE